MRGNPVHGVLDPDESPPNGNAIGAPTSASHMRVTNTQTDRHTDHATCDNCSNRPHLMHCVQAKRPKKGTTLLLTTTKPNADHFRSMCVYI